MTSRRPPPLHPTERTKLKTAFGQLFLPPFWAHFGLLWFWPWFACVLHVASNSISCQRQVAIIFGPRQIEQSKCKSDNWRRAFSAANFATKLSATLPLHCCNPCFCCSSDAEGRSCSKREARMSDGAGMHYKKQGTPSFTQGINFIIKWYTLL